MNDVSGDVGFYDYWTAACAAVTNSTPLPPITDGKPQAGYYKMRQIKGGPWLPVAIFRDAGRLVVLIGDDEAKNSNQAWISCASHPISYEIYQSRIESGAWPGGRSDPGARDAVIGDNAAATETIEHALPREVDAVKAWLEQTAIDTDDLAEEAGNRVGELRKLKSRATEAHEAEKEPHLKAGREVDARYLPSIKRADAAIKYLLDKINAFADKKIAAARKAAQAEADRLAAIRAVEEKAVASARAAAGRQEGGDEGSVPQALTPTAPPPPAMVPPKLAFGGAVGSKVSQRAVAVAVIEDIDRCFQHFRDNPLVVECLQKLAQKMIDAKMAVPGVVTVEKTVTR